jgi:hypothetical protein
MKRQRIKHSILFQCISAGKEAQVTGLFQWVAARFTTLLVTTFFFEVHWQNMQEYSLGEIITTTNGCNVWKKGKEESKHEKTDRGKESAYSGD